MNDFPFQRIKRASKKVTTMLISFNGLRMNIHKCMSSIVYSYKKDMTVTLIKLCMYKTCRARVNK